MNFEAIWQEVQEKVAEDHRKYRARTAILPKRDDLREALEEYPVASYVTSPAVSVKGRWWYEYSRLRISWEAGQVEVVATRISTQDSWAECIGLENNHWATGPYLLQHRSGKAVLKEFPKAGLMTQQEEVWVSRDFGLLSEAEQASLLRAAQCGYHLEVLATKVNVWPHRIPSIVVVRKPGPRAPLVVLGGWPKDAVYKNWRESAPEAVLVASRLLSL